MAGTISTETYSKTCLDVAMETLRDVNADVVAFVRDLGQANKELPDQFDVTSDKWMEAQQRIDDYCAARDLDKLLDACSEYKQRAARFLDGWRQKLGMPPKGESHATAT